MQQSPRKLQLTTIAIATSMLFAFAVSPGLAAEAPATEKRVATVSAIRPPHQGFAFATPVESDTACLALAQNLAAEIGMAVHVMCSDATGKTTVVAECGFSAEVDGKTVTGWTAEGWHHPETKYLICVAPEKRRYPARRIAPDLARLRP